MGQPINYLKIEKFEFSGTDKGVFPAATSAVGTMSSDDTVLTGVSTEFTKKVVINDYIFSETLNEIRQVQGVLDDTTLYLQEPFSSNVAGDQFNFARVKYTSVTVENTGATAAPLDGGTIDAGKIEIYNSDWGVEPITFDCSGNTLKFDAGL